MARLRITLAPLRGHTLPSGEVRSVRMIHCNYQILLGIIASLTVLACGGAAGTPQSARIADLESYTAQLESQLTVLKERSLEQERSHCKTGGTKTIAAEAEVTSETEAAVAPEAESVEDPAPVQAKMQPKATGGAPADLPVVHLTPGGPTTAARSAVLADEQDEEKAESQKGDAEDNTRPVLKIHESQDGQVYHRPLTNADRQKTPSP